LQNNILNKDGFFDVFRLQGAKRWVLRLKFNKNIKARTLAAKIIETFRYRHIALTVKLNLG